MIQMKSAFLTGNGNSLPLDLLSVFDKAIFSSSSNQWLLILARLHGVKVYLMVINEASMEVSFVSKEVEVSFFVDDANPLSFGFSGWSVLDGLASDHIPVGSLA